MSDFQKSFSESTSSIKFDEKYIDNSVQPNDIGVAEQWAVKTVADPCVGNLATPVNSGSVSYTHLTLPTINWV